LIVYKGFNVSVLKKAESQKHLDKNLEFSDAQIAIASHSPPPPTSPLSTTIEAALPAKLLSYIKRGRKKIGGWFSLNDAMVFAHLLNAQTQWKLQGAVAEIGVHHGKSFIALCLGRTAHEKALCIDIFDDQQHNKDHSGSGSESIFRKNLTHAGIDTASLTILKRSSLEVSAPEITQAVGQVRFFSVDGGHWLEIAKHDLTLASDTLSEGGIIALDDYSHPDWPEVSLGFYEWFKASDGSVVPFLITNNKLYLAKKEWAARYAEHIHSVTQLRSYYKKTTQIMGSNVKVFTPYACFWGRSKQMLMNKNQKLYDTLKGISHHYFKV
jgi:hypothetical protein